MKAGAKENRMKVSAEGVRTSEAYALHTDGVAAVIGIHSPLGAGCTCWGVGGALVGREVADSLSDDLENRETEGTGLPAACLRCLKFTYF